MKTFLGIVAGSLWRQYGGEISSLRILVPNARSRIFFNEELAAIAGKPLWEPVFVTVDDLMFEIAGCERADGVKALVELYKAWSSYHNESFDRFYYWGEMLLADFDQIDKYMVDTGKLFSNLADLKALENNLSYLEEEQREVVRRFWSTFGRQEDYSDEKKDFLGVWNTLNDIYMRFRASLMQSGMATAGMAHRIAAEKIKNGEVQEAGNPESRGTKEAENIKGGVISGKPAATPCCKAAGRYAVIGFNALTECEKVLFDYLHGSGSADFFWDYDDYYVADDSEQEAGLFLRENKKRYPAPEWFVHDSDNFRSEKRISVVSAGSDSLQCKYVAPFLREVASDRPAGGANIATDKDNTGASDLQCGGGESTSLTEDKPVLSNIGRETAIVLTDENLLLPLLYSIPKQVHDINVTMGYPLRQTPAYSFVERLLKLQGGARVKNGVPEFYHADVLGILAHPYVAAADGPAARELADDIAGKSRIFIPQGYFAGGGIVDEFENVTDGFSEAGNRVACGFSQSVNGVASGPAGGLITKIFRAQSSAADIIAYITEILTDISTQGMPNAKIESQAKPAGLVDSAQAGTTQFPELFNTTLAKTPPHSAGLANTATADIIQAADREYFAVIAENLVKLGNSISGSGLEIDIRTLSSLARRMLQSLRIPFSGEPLSGLQVMGILETRNLDFRNVMLVSMNDDNFPGNLSTGSSFIPYSLRAAYGLPTPRHHEGVWAYYFYRLLQRAESVQMIYCSRNDENSSGEPSRYIHQLEYESPHTIRRRHIGTEVNLSAVQPITVAKEGRALAELERFLGGGRRLSPSAFNAWLDCPLKFYFRYLAGIEPQDEVLEQVDTPMLGTLLHKAMEILYSPFRGVADAREGIRALIGSPRVAQAVDEAITIEFFHSENTPECTGNASAQNFVEQKCTPENISTQDYTGNLLLARDVVIKYINGAILPFDAGRESFAVAELEKNLQAEFRFTVNGEPRSVNFYGKADRVDIVGEGLIGIVDYKTGSPHADFAGVAALFEESPKERRPVAVLQTLLYSMMASRMQQKGELAGSDSLPALYYVRIMNREDYSPWLAAGQPENYSFYGEEFEEFLAGRLAALFDTSLPFRQCADTKPCAYCDFNALCLRV